MPLSFKMPSTTVVSNLPGEPFGASTLQRFTVLLLGSGGRESALAWKIAQSPVLEKLYIAPGNAGTEQYGENVPLKVTDVDAISQFVTDNGVNLIVVGPEDPLIQGIADYFAGRVPVVGPMAAAARLEGSKNFAKEFMQRHHIPTAAYRTFGTHDIEDGYKFLESLKAPYVLKADGLAAGKGVIIGKTLDEAKTAFRQMLEGKFGKASEKVVIEQFLDGIECSVFVLTDGNGEYCLLPVAKDYKRIGEGDTGLNTGGMGAVSPVPFADDTFMLKVKNRIIVPTLEGLKAEGLIYRGFIFFGLINVKGEPMVIEYNCRMGDPETEAVMPRITSDLLDAMHAAASGNLAGRELKISPKACTTVMAVSKGYPEAYEKGKPITLPKADEIDSIIFHAGTAKTGDDVITSGGRVLTCSSVAPSLAEALKKSYDTIEKVAFDGKTYRRDIGHEFVD